MKPSAVNRLVRAFAVLTVLMITSAPAGATTRFLGGATVTSVTSVLRPWTQDYACSCCVCWETALATVYAFWDDHVWVAEGPWARLLPGGNGRHDAAFKATTQRLYELADIACNEGSDIGWLLGASAATQVGRDYNDELGYDFEHDFDWVVWFGQDIRDEIDDNKPVYYSFTGPFQGDEDVSHATVIVGYESSEEILYIYDNWDPWASARGLNISDDSRTVNVTPGGCDCSSGVCCNGCGFAFQNTVCKVNDDSEKGCPFGTGCGSKVGIRYRSRVCTGEKAACDENYGPWSAWSVSHTCEANAACTLGSVAGNAFCIAQAECSEEPCEDECPAETYQCSSGTEWQYCGSYDSDPCVEWSDPAPCDEGEVCEDAVCFVPCESECVPGERRCASSTNYRVCEVSEDDNCAHFVAAQACPAGDRCDPVTGDCVTPLPDASLADVAQGGDEVEAPPPDVGPEADLDLLDTVPGPAGEVTSGASGGCSQGAARVNPIAAFFALLLAYAVLTGRARRGHGGVRHP